MSESPTNTVFEGPLAISEYRFTATEDFRFNSNFVELLTLPETQLHGLTLLVINGEVPNGSDDNIGQITWAVDLSSAVADEDGFLLIGTEELATFDAGDIVVPGFNPNGNAQTILVVRDFTGAAGDDLDTDDDGIIDNPPFSDVVVGLALRDEDRDQDVLYAEDEVQADPLAIGFISAGAARQPDGDGAFVTLPYDTPAQDTPGFANVEGEDPQEPAFAVQIGTVAQDVLRALDDQRNLLVGEAGDDSLQGGNVADLIFDGTGNDRSNGNGGDDILVFQGGKDRTSGGEGADVFKLAADYASNDTRDKLTIFDFDVAEDVLDVTGALIASTSVNAKGTLVRLVGDGDVIELRGVTDFDAVVFANAALPDTGVPLDDIADLEPGEAAVLTLTTQDDGPRLNGSVADDVFVFFGGETAHAHGNGGADRFILNTAMKENGVRETVKFRDYDADDVVDITGFEINRFKEEGNRVKVFVGPNNDKLEFTGISTFDEIVFVSDAPLG